MKIALFASECVPFAKSGGLADVVSALSLELTLQKHDVKVFMPLYPQIKETYHNELTHIGYFFSLDKYVGIHQLIYNDVCFILLDNENMFNRQNLYGYDDDCYRFGWFSRASLDTLGYLDWFPDIVHVHDWHTALAPYILKTYHCRDWRYHKIKTVLTIHNIRFQGWAPLELAKHLKLEFSNDFVFNDSINFLKAGIQTAHKINTVSPTYRNETLTPIFGEGLNEVLSQRASDYSGILNGIDLTYFGPSTSPFVMHHFNKRSYKSGKNKNKEALYQMYDIHTNLQAPLYSMITRITDQKGFDLVNQVITNMLTNDIQVFILGSGDHYYSDFLHQIHNNNSNFFFYDGYNESLAHQLYASSDFFMMPSKFEPCGLAQMISLQFGTIPIVFETGGLKDSIVPYNEYEGSGYGFTFSRYSTNDLLWAFYYSLDIYHKKTHLRQLIQNGFKADFSMKKSADDYLALYQSII